MLKKKILISIVTLIISFGVFVLAVDIEMIGEEDIIRSKNIVYKPMLKDDIEIDQTDLNFYGLKMWNEGIKSIKYGKIEKDDSGISKKQQLIFIKQKDSGTTTESHFEQIPKSVQEDLYTYEYDEYEKYCRRFPNCPAFEDMKYYTAIFDINGREVIYNLKRENIETGEFYPSERINDTEYGLSIRYYNFNDSVDIEFNDIVYTGGLIQINGTQTCKEVNEWILENASNCTYISNVTSDENMTVYIHKCRWVLLNDSTMNCSKEGIIFDANIESGNIGKFLYQYNTTIIFDEVLFGTTTNAVTNTFGLRYDGGGAQGTSRQFITDSVFQNFGSENDRPLVSQFSNGSINETSFYRSSIGQGGTFSVVSGDNVNVIGGSVTNFNGDISNFKIITDLPNCFVTVFGSSTITLDSPYLECGTNLVGGFFAFFSFDLKNPISINTVNATGSGVDLEVNFTYTLENNYRNNNWTDEIIVNTTCIDNQGNTATQLGANFSYDFLASRFTINATGPATTDYMPLTCNITNSSYFPKYDYKYYLTEFKRNDYPMYEIPYALELNPNSDFGLNL